MDSELLRDILRFVLVLALVSIGGGFIVQAVNGTPWYTWALMVVGMTVVCFVIEWILGVLRVTQQHSKT